MNIYEKIARDMLAKYPNLQSNQMISNAVSHAEQGDVNGVKQIANNTGGQMGVNMQQVLNNILQRIPRG